MKKLLLSLMLLPALAFVSSCSNDDDDLPEANIEVAISGGQQSSVDNKIYVERGTPLVFESLTAVPTNGKKTTLGLTTYYLNGLPQAQTAVEPFGATLETFDLEPGSYTLQIKSAIYQIDKSAAFVLLTFDLVVTEPDTDTSDTPDTSTAEPSAQQIAAQ